MDPQLIQNLFEEMKPQIEGQIIESIKTYSQKNQYGLSNIPQHEHSGSDTTQISYQNLTSKSIFITARVGGTAAATATNYGVFFIAPYACNILSVYETHAVAGTDGGAVSLNIEKLTPNVALDSGIALLPTAFNLKASAKYAYSGYLTSTLSSKQLALGDRLALKDGGVLTSVSDVCVIIEIQY